MGAGILADPAPPRRFLPQVLLNVLADEIHRAHQKCISSGSCDPNTKKMDFVFEAGASAMKLLRGSYSCICLVKDVGLVAFRDPHGIRCGTPVSFGCCCRCCAARHAL